MSDQKRTYKVVMVLADKRTTAVLIEAHHVGVSDSGALCLWDNKGCIVEAYASGTWKHVTEEEVEEEVGFESDLGDDDDENPIS